MTTLIRDVAIHDRPRERLLRQGAAALSDAELVALHLGTGAAGASALDVARTLLTIWGGMDGLARAHPHELARTPGVGPAKAARISAAFGMANRLGRPHGIRLSRSADIAHEAARLLDGSQVEQVAVLVTDGGLRLRHAGVVARGSATACPMPVREIISAVLRHDGVAFAVTHNHPGGDPSPSADDRSATTAIREAAKVTGLRFLDHVVIAGADWRSAS